MPSSPIDARPGLTSRTIQLACAWSGVVLVVGFLIGWIGLAGYIPPPSPSASADEIRAFYLDGLTEKRLGLLLCMSLWALLVPWGVVVATQTRRSERGFPVLSVIQVACATSTMALGVLMLMVWGVAAFRPDELAPGVTRMLNDLGWFIFLIDWAPVTVWCWTVALAILQDRRPEAPYPRWLAYFSLWVGLIFFPAGLIIFFKTGPFAFNGLLALYLPGLAFFAWYLVFTAYTVRAVRRDPAV